MDLIHQELLILSIEDIKQDWVIEEIMVALMVVVVLSEVVGAVVVGQVEEEVDTLMEK